MLPLFYKPNFDQIDTPYWNGLFYINLQPYKGFKNKIYFTSVEYSKNLGMLTKMENATKTKQMRIEECLPN